MIARTLALAASVVVSTACGHARTVQDVELSQGRRGRALEPAALARRTAGAVGVITTDIGRGMAFVVDPAGYLITNRHVVEDAGYVESVTFPALDPVQTFSSVEVVYIDPQRDLALLRIEPTARLPHLDVAALQAMPIGDYVAGRDRVMLMTRKGLGEESRRGDPVEAGLIAQLGEIQGLDVYNPVVGPGPYLGLSTDVRQGQSGGPVLDRYGRAIGVVTWTWKDRNGGFAIPIGEAARMLGERPRLTNSDEQQSRAESRARSFLDAMGSGEIEAARRITSPSHARAVRRGTVDLILSRQYEAAILEPYVEALEGLLATGADPFAGLERLAVETGSEDFRRAIGVEGQMTPASVVAFFFELGQAYLAARYYGEREHDESMEIALRRLHSLEAARSFVLADLAIDLESADLEIDRVDVLPGVYAPRAVVIARRGPLRLALQMRLEWGDWYVGEVQVADAP